MVSLFPTARFIWDPGVVALAPHGIGLYKVSGVQSSELWQMTHPVRWDQRPPSPCLTGDVMASAMSNLLAVPMNPTTSFFHYSHPVLSHPTLMSPSIDRDPLASVSRRSVTPLPMLSIQLFPACAFNMVFRFWLRRRDSSMFRFLAPETTMARPLLFIQSLFKYSHPVLSWPTVPNIR